MTDEEKAEILKSTEKLWNERNKLKRIEKENEDLKKQIGKMKCCGNCKNKNSKLTCFFCVKLNKWELAE